MLKTVLERLRKKPVDTVEIALARRRMFPSAIGPGRCGPDDLVRRKGLEIYDLMQTDSQVAASLATKKFAVLSSGWDLEPASGSGPDRRAHRFCRFALAEMRGSVEDMLFNVLDALAKGYSISEMNFRAFRGGEWDGMIGLASIKHKDPALFDFRTDEFLNVTALVRLPSDARPEALLPPEKFVIYTYMPCYEEPQGRSDLRACYPHWWAKDIILRFFATYLERYGSPVIKGTYRRGATHAQQQELLRILDSVQHETAMVIPEDISVELVEAAFHGETGYLDAMAYHDRQIAKVILGETLTQEEGQRTGALALARVHQDTMRLRLEKIKRDLEETVMREQVLRPLTLLNFEGANVPRFVLGGGARTER